MSRGRMGGTVRCKFYKLGPGQNRSKQTDQCRAATAYCVGSIICVKPIVLTVRSIGVSGGSKLGVKKLVSNR